MRKDTLLFLTIQMNLEDIMLSEISQAGSFWIQQPVLAKRSFYVVLRFIHVE